MTRSLTILGATGSVGSQTLDLVARNPGRWQVEALTAGSDVAGLVSAAKACGARFVAIADSAKGEALKAALAGTGIASGAGESALVDAAARDAEIVITAIVGAAGLPPTMAAVKRGAQIGIANKETLVCAGPVVTAAATAHGATLLPVDSEHNAIFQVFPHDDPAQVERVILTASGGPFRTKSRDEMRGVSVADACKHPTWSMGAKISIDSATLMNKGLELIEAAHLFPIGLDKIEILVHPQSVIHSMVEFRDCSTLAQLGSPDMRIPIAHALAWPERIATPCTPLDLATIGRLDFEQPDAGRFPSLRLAREAAQVGGTAPATLNAANEVAVAGFLAGRVGFLEIAIIVEETLSQQKAGTPRRIGDVLEADRQARETAGRILERVQV